MTKLPKRIRPLGQERPRKGALPDSSPADPHRDPAKLLGPTERLDFEAAVLASAILFRVVVRRKGIEPRDEERETLAEACVAAAGLGVADTLIYAVNADGRAVLVLAGGKRVRQ